MMRLAQRAAGVVARSTAVRRVVAPSAVARRAGAVTRSAAVSARAVRANRWYSTSPASWAQAEGEEEEEVAGLPEGLRPRPFRVLGVQQVAIGAPSRKRLERLWVDVFGLNKVGEFASEKENVDESILQVGGGDAAVEIDLMQPLDINKKPAVHLPPLNHLGLWVDDIEEAVAWLEEAGVRFAPGGVRVGASGHKVTFIHPKANHVFPLCGEGILIELVQAPQSVIDFYTSLEA